MKNSILVILVFISATLSAQNRGGYVALKTGLNIRDKASTTGKVIDKIPYGTKVIFLETPEEPEMIRTEGMTGYWRKVTYNNKTGYIIDSYLFPVAPPKATVKKMKDYL